MFSRQPSTQPAGFLKGLGVAQVCKVGDDAWQKQIFQHLFFQHFWDFSLGNFCHLGLRLVFISLAFTAVVRIRRCKASQIRRLHKSGLIKAGCVQESAD